MRNHVHFIAIPSKGDSLAKTFNTAHMRYSQYFNKKLRQRGHLWQGRFYSCILDGSHLIFAARYIERNPLRAGIVEKPWLWPWSSAIGHIHEKADGFIKLGNLFDLIGMLGATTFIEKLEARIGRKLCVLPVGRPKKS